MPWGKPDSLPCFESRQSAWDCISGLVPRNIAARRMKLLLKTSLILATCLHCAAAGEAEWLEIAKPPAGWSDSLPTANKRRTAFVLDTPTATRLRGFLVGSRFPVAVDEKTIRGEVAEFFKTNPLPGAAELKIEWLAGGETPEDFTRSIEKKGGQIRSRYRLGDTTVTRTVIVAKDDDAVFIHLLANQPGALNFRVTLETEPEEKVRIQDRRQLLLAPATGPASHVWVLPFESDVSPDGGGLAVKGEGEALIIWSYAAGNDAVKALSQTLSKLGNRYDPGNTSADPSKIWHGVLESHLKSVENSP
jgi:hypothetical protein